LLIIYIKSRFLMYNIKHKRDFREFANDFLDVFALINYITWSV